MHCPQCKGIELQPSALELELSAYSCPKCDATLLPLNHYLRWAKIHFHGRPVTLDTFSNVSDYACPRACPKCSELMYNYDVHPELGDKLKACDECKLAWLTPEQWGVLKTFYLENAYPPAISPADRYHFADSYAQIQKDKHFKTLLSKDDYRTAAEFKLWLKRHPLQNDILDFLD